MLRIFNREKQAKKVGLALGGGAVRGFAHIGVLKVLEVERIPVHAIAGVSAGSIIGALFASGIPAVTLEDLACKVKWNHLVGLVPSINGPISNQALIRYLKRHFNLSEFSTLKIPFKVIATDIRSGEKHVYTEGNLLHAIRASCQFPGVFSPLEKPFNYIFDGGLCGNIPVWEVREMGMNMVIAVDVLPRKQVHYDPGNIFQVVDRAVDLLLKDNSQKEKDLADVVIEPVTKEIYSFDIARVKELITMGEVAARGAIPEIKRFLK